MSDELLDQLAGIATNAEPPMLPDERADAMIAFATRSAAHKPNRWVWAAAAAALLVAGLGAGWWAGQQTDPLQAALPTGDVLTATPGARFEVRSAAPEHRRVDVDEGVVLFDVRPLTDDQAFEVRTEEVVVRVRGTVFSVEREGGTSVRVYEGRVDVEAGGTITRVAAGEMWRDGAIAALEGGALEEDGERAALARAEPAQLAHATPAETVDRPQVEEALVEEALVEEPPQVEEPPLEEPVEEPPVEVVAEAPEVAEPAEPRRVARPAGRTQPQVTRDVARSWIANGDFERALDVARRRGWRLVEADALRALQRFAEAAEVYEAVGDSRAAYAAARIHFLELNDPDAALRALETIEEGSPLAERSLALRVRALRRVGRTEEARRFAETYLARFPQGGLADWMQALVDES
ncbi:MAG: FecR domain-containing protein [Myxococcota bacterium]